MSCNTPEIPATTTHRRELRLRARPTGRDDDGRFEAAEPMRGRATGAMAALAGRWIARADLMANDPHVRLGGLVAFHGSASAAIYLLAYLVRWEGEVPSAAWKTALATLPLVVGLKTAACILMGCHRGSWRSATFADIANSAEAAVFGSILLVSTPMSRFIGHNIPASVLLIDCVGSVFAICGVRGATRLIRERYGPPLSARHTERALVVGAGEAGEAVVRQVGGQPRLGLKVVGVLDADRATHGRTVAGAPVLGDASDLARIAARLHARILLIPTPAVPAREVRALVRACGEARLEARIVPGLDALLSGNVTVQPRAVDIQDLLSRESVRLDDESVGRFLRGRVVLVTGAAGSIGSEVCRQVLTYRPRRLILLDHSENGLFHVERELRELAGATEVVARVASITDAPRLRTTFQRYRPAVVFHAAAHKHVPMMESNPGEAVKTIVFGTKALIDRAMRAGVGAFVMISTDKAVNPSSVMGACKRLAEAYAQTVSGLTKTRMVTVRFGNVLGSNGSVVPLFEEQVRNGGPVTVTHPEMTRYFMTIPEASQLVLQAGAQGKGGEIFVLDMGEPVKVLDLARDVIRLSGHQVGRGIEIVFTGLRPGEKLFEELYGDGEELVPTPHPKILAARHRPYPPDRLSDGLERLAAAVDGPDDHIDALLGELVPGFRR